MEDNARISHDEDYEGENSLEFSCAVDEETYHVGRPCEEDYV